MIEIEVTEYEYYDEEVEDEKDDKVDSLDLKSKFIKQEPKK